MKTKDALAFLEAHQPMPDAPGAALLDTYSEVIRRLYQDPVEACIPLLLGSLARWDDWTIYENVQSVLRRFPASLVIPHLAAHLDNPSETIRFWTADTVQHFPSDVLVPPLVKLFGRSAPETRHIAASTLEVIGTVSAVEAARQLLPVENEEDVREVLEDIIKRGVVS